MRKSRRGFTMAELLASIGIIALSMAICLPVPEITLDEAALDDDGPVTVRLFQCDVENLSLQEMELQVRESLDGTELQFCGIEVLDAGRYTLAVWSPESVSPDANRELLNSALGSNWTVRHQAEESRLFAMND